MKKILAKLAQVDSDDVGNSYNNFGSGASSHHASFVGRQFHMGRFSLFVEDTIAEGGFGMVFRVRSQKGQHYALKRTCVNSEQDLAVCKREITIVSSLSHKNILRYIDSCINQLHQGVYEILMLTAFYPVSLSQFLQERRQKQQRLTEVEVLRVFCDVCEAVCRLHHCKTPIIHRDLKVENVLIDERQNFVLCDFGSATSRVLLPSAHGLVRCKEEIERYTTLAYRAPELIDLYRSIPLGPQIDIWAMGCLLYILCFASLPFGDSALAIQSGNYSLPDSSPYSERLHKLIGCLLCVDAYKRPDIFQTCALAFSLSGRTNPAQNLNNLPIPRWQDLATPPRESQLKANVARIDHSNSPQRSPPSGHPDSRKPIDTPTESSGGNTSVVPRQRPRATATCPITALPSLNLGPVRSDVVDARSIPATVVIKPPLPPPPSPPASSAPSETVAESSANLGETCEFTPFPGDTDPFGEQITRLAWEADFSTASEPKTVSVASIPTASNTAVQASPTTDTLVLPSRGHHQRTWSADVDYTNRIAPVFSNAAQTHVPRNTEPKNSGLQPQPIWEPFSPQLRQVQSLVSLPTSTISADHAKVGDVPRGTMSGCVHHGDSSTLVFSSPSDCCRLHDTGSFPKPQAPTAPRPVPPTATPHWRVPAGKPHLVVDEDVLFGAAFDAIRLNSGSGGLESQGSIHSTNIENTLNSSVATAAGWDNPNRSGSTSDNGTV